MRTTSSEGNGEFETATKHSPNIPGQIGGENEESLKFPKKLRHKGRGKVWATIYKRPDQPQPYRLYWRVRVDGKPVSRMRDFDTYSGAKREGDKVVADLVKGRQASVLSPGQASDALAALQRLQSFHAATGLRVSLLGGISEYCEVITKLNGRSLREAVDGYLTTVVSVRRIALAKAVEDFIALEEPRTKAEPGKRPDLSPKYHYNRAIMLRRFAGAFPGHAVSDLTKDLLDAFIGGLAKLKSKSRNGKPVTSAKGRNHHRAAIRQFLTWAVRKDYLAATHRLGEADKMQAENGNTAEIQFYTPAEFQALLDTATGSLRALIAIGGLAGLRTAELLRLTWEDVWRVENHIEVSKGKSKTRQRRLVEIVPVLAQWLEPFRDKQGKICDLHEITFQQHFCDLCDNAQVEVKGKKVAVSRKPNGLPHAFCTYHFAAHGNENLTAMQAGNSPQMLHTNYKGLATKKEAEQWFAVAPTQPANVVPLGSAMQS